MTAMLDWVKEELLGDRTQDPRSGLRRYKRFLKRISFVEGRPGDHIKDVLREMTVLSEAFGLRTYTYFNDIYIVVKRGDSLEELYNLFSQKMWERRERYKRSFRYKLQVREMEKQQKDAARRKEIVQGWMEEEKMKVKLFKIFKYWKAKRINKSSSYSNRVITYAHEWAVGMQRAMREGKEISEVANEMGHFVDYDGISGFMHGRAASFIACFWKHGEKFRKWYNCYYQIGDQGERANKEKGAVLNPAILTIGED